MIENLIACTIGIPAFLICATMIGCATVALLDTIDAFVHGERIPKMMNRWEDGHIN